MTRLRNALSLLTDISSEMIAPLRAVFLVLVLGRPLPVAGLIEGLAETAASLLKLDSGRLADRIARRKPLLVAGYALLNAAKPLLSLAGGWPDVLGIVLADRTGKGLRTSPRNALLANATSAAFRGKAFGFHRALDTAGATLGPLLAVLLISESPEEDQQSLQVLRRSSPGRYCRASSACWSCWPFCARGAGTGSLARRPLCGRSPGPAGVRSARLAGRSGFSPGWRPCSP